MNRNSFLWILAILTFGVGDLVTTWYGLSIGLSEAHFAYQFLNGDAPVVPVILVVKTGFFAFMYLLHRDVPFGIGVPIGLAGLGIVITAWNSYLILTVT